MENGGSNAKYSGRKRKRERIKEIALLRIKGFASEHLQIKNYPLGAIQGDFSLFFGTVVI